MIRELLGIFCGEGRNSKCKQYALPVIEGTVSGAEPFRVTTERVIVSSIVLTLSHVIKQPLAHTSLANQVEFHTSPGIYHVT
jgi:hypothetical protein